MLDHVFLSVSDIERSTEATTCGPVPLLNCHNEI
jgi:hypothetical protein